MLNYFRVKIVSDGKKRKLVICDTLRADGGEISVKTNSDKSKCNLRVAFANKFITGMPPKTTAIEREPFTATVEVKVKKNNYSWNRVVLVVWLLDFLDILQILFIRFI